MQREVIKWLQSLDLTYPVRNPRRDFSNGFIAAEILSRYVGSSYISMQGITNSTSPDARRSNWEQVLSALQRLGCRTITPYSVDNVIQLNPNAALNVLEHLYEFLNKKLLPMRTIDAGEAGVFLGHRDTTAVNALLETVEEVPPNSIPTKLPPGADPEEEQAQAHFTVTALHNKLAMVRNTEIAGGLRPLKNPRYTHQTVSTLIHNANHRRHNIVLGRDKYLPDELETQKRNERIIYQHGKVGDLIQESSTRPEYKVPLTTLLRGRYANSKIYEQKRDQRSRQARSSSQNLLQDADNSIGTRKLEVNVMSDTLMRALESNGIYLSRDARAGEKSVEFFTSCGFNIRKAFSSILKDVLAAHRELLSVIERSGKNSEGDVLEDLFTAFVSQRDQIPMEALQACWTALEQNTAGIAAAVSARDEEYGYIIQTLSYVFTLEASQVQALHVSGVVDDGRSSSARTSGGQPGLPHAPRRNRSQSVGHALLDAEFKENAMEAGAQPSRRLAVRMDRQAFHLASAFVLLSKIGEALQECNPYVAEVAMEHYFLPAALPSLIQCSRAGMMEAVARVIVSSCMGKKEEEEDYAGHTSEEVEEKRAASRARVEKLVNFMEYVIQPLVINGNETSGIGILYRPQKNSHVAQNRHRYYLLLYHVMRQTAESHVMTVELNFESQTEVGENPLVTLASDTAARCLSSEHTSTRAMGIATTLMLLLWDCWVPFISMVKEFILRPALESRDAQGGASLSSMAGDWEGRVLTLDLLCLLFKKVVLLLSEESIPITEDPNAKEGYDALCHHVVEMLPFSQLDQAATRYLKTFSYGPLPQRQLALSIVGQHLLPDGHPLLAATWLREVVSLPSARFQSILLSEEDHPRLMRWTIPADYAGSKGPGASLINNTYERPASVYGGCSTISLLLGRVEPTYSILPLNQLWDTYSVVHVVLRYLHRIDTVRALALIAAALMSPQEEESQLTHLMRNFHFALICDRCQTSPHVNFEGDSIHRSTPVEMQFMEGSSDTGTTSLRELVLTSTARGLDPFLDSPHHHNTKRVERQQNSTSHVDFSDEEEGYSEDEVSGSYHDKLPMDGYRVSKAFWYTTLQRIESALMPLLPTFNDMTRLYDDLSFSEQLSSAVLLTIFRRYVKGCAWPPSAVKMEDIREAVLWLQHQKTTW